MQQTPSGANGVQGEAKVTKSGRGKSFATLLGCVALPLLIGFIGIIAMVLVVFEGDVRRLLREMVYETSQQTKARQDLQLMGNALEPKSEFYPEPLEPKLRRLFGENFQSVPNDPWGNKYLIDTSVGVIVTFGADAVPGGEGADKDLFVRFRPPLSVQRVQYARPWGRPSSKNKLRVTFSRPLQVVNESSLLKSLSLLRNTRDHRDGLAVSMARLNSGYGHDWRLNSQKSNPEELALLVFENHADVLSAKQSVTPTMAIDLSQPHPKDLKVPDVERSALFGIREKIMAKGPLDRTVYGTEVKKFSSPIVSDRIRKDGFRWGIKIERF